MRVCRDLEIASTLNRNYVGANPITRSNFIRYFAFFVKK